MLHHAGAQEAGVLAEKNIAHTKKTEAKTEEKTDGEKEEKKPKKKRGSVCPQMLLDYKLIH